MPHPLLEPQADVLLADFTTWRVGGPAQWLLEPKSVDETTAALQWAKTEGLPSRVIGAGSNLLIHDDGLPGLTVSLRHMQGAELDQREGVICLLYTSPSPRDMRRSRMPSSA